MFEVVHHTETTSNYSWIVCKKGSGLDRVLTIGKRGGFKTKQEADIACHDLNRAQDE